MISSEVARLVARNARVALKIDLVHDDVDRRVPFVGHKALT
jgi:hypothetical protein